jgi:DNA-binding PadR family transcriptional regulator
MSEKSELMPGTLDMLILTETNRRARYYTLTAAGRKQLGLELTQFEQVIAAIGRVLQDA